VRNKIAKAMVALSLAIGALSYSAARAQTLRRVPAITQPVDESKLVRVPGNVRPEANAQNDRGPVDDHLRLDHLLLQLKRPAETEGAVERFLESQQDPQSPNFHKWLIAAQFGERFGTVEQDLEVVSRWLSSRGFAVNQVHPNGMLIDFFGNSRPSARGVPYRDSQPGSERDRPHRQYERPADPGALAPVVAGVVSLHDFRPHALSVPRANYTVSATLEPVVPGDLATIYNFNPAYLAGYTGAGQTIVVIEDSDVYKTADFTTFRSTFGLTSQYPSGSLTQVHPTGGAGGTCADPGATADDAEAEIDAEWASAAAPNAAIELASCANTRTNFGGFIALQNLLAETTPPSIVSISYGESEAANGATGNLYIYDLYQTAVAEGVSLFVAAGDSGAASSDAGSNATHGITISAYASTPYNVAVGGTDFADTFQNTNSSYWSATNGEYYNSALSYIPEIPWNNSCAGQLLANYRGFSTTYGASGFCASNTAQSDGSLTLVAASGGPSNCATGTPAESGFVGGTCQGYPKPSWQSVYGNPSDGVRDIPDVALFAANGIWGHYYVTCYSDPGKGRGGAPCTGPPSTWAGYGGTSFASPEMAGIQALINQKMAAAQGNPNYQLYSLAQTEYENAGNAACSSSSSTGTCVFNDITLGDMDVNCGANAPNCFDPGGAVNGGVLSTSTSSYAPAYAAASGWDFATGIGTVNVYLLVSGWPSAPLTAQTITFNPLANVTFGVAPFSISATASSGLTVIFTSGTTTVCTVSGTTVTVTAGGTCSITASQPGNATYAAATLVTQSFSVNPAAQTITFNPLANVTFGVAPFSISATASSGLTVIFASTITPVCTVSASTVTIVGVGTCSINATQPGNASFLAAAPVNQAFAVGSPVPALASPSNGATGVSLTPTLVWSASPGATSYNVYLGTSSPPALTLQGTTLTSFTPASLVQGITYYWQIVATNGNGSYASPIWSFTTMTVACISSLGSTSATWPSMGGSYTVAVNDSSGCVWSATSNSRWIAITSGTNGNGNGIVSYSVAANGSSSSHVGTMTIAGVTFTVNQSGADPVLRFVAVTPCRIADTRNADGPFGGPAIAANGSRDFAIPASACGIPATAAAHSLNLTVVPLGPLGYLSVWPSGQPQPAVSTLNSADGRVKANAAIVPSGVNGAVTVFGSNSTNVIIDINGYFVPDPEGLALAFYPLLPCRIADTRTGTGTFAGPSLAPSVARSFPIQASSCGIPATAQAYALNLTVVPSGALGFLSAWPAGSPQPGSSTLNAPTGTVVANAAIVPAGTGGAIDVIGTNPTDLIIDINGYFAPPGGPGALSFYAVTPCRIMDTRGADGTFGGPILGAAQARTVPIQSSACNIPSTASAYSLNATVVPPAPLGFLSLWDTGGAQPSVSTLNAYDGSIVANAAIVPAGTSGAINAFASNATQLILDINGYFAP